MVEEEDLDDNNVTAAVVSRRSDDGSNIHNHTNSSSNPDNRSSSNTTTTTARIATTTTTTTMNGSSLLPGIDEQPGVNRNTIVSSNNSNTNSSNNTNSDTVVSITAANKRFRSLSSVESTTSHNSSGNGDSQSASSESLTSHSVVTTSGTGGATAVPSSVGLRPPAIFSPPLGLEKRFEEVLKLEHKSVSYKISQKIIDKNKTNEPKNNNEPKVNPVQSMSSSSQRHLNDDNNNSHIHGNDHHDDNHHDDHHHNDDDNELDHDDDDDGPLVVPSITQEELEKLLYAKDMYELSPTEREHVLQDIHGVQTSTAQELEEMEMMDGRMTTRPSRDEHAATHTTHTTRGHEFISMKRQQLQQALLQSPTHGTAAYSQALASGCYGYIHSAEFQLPFLRANRWNVDATAKHIIDYFDIKLQLFGPNLLCKPTITYHDLTKDDRKALDSGFFQFLPVRDVAGRAVMVAFPPVGRVGQIKSLVRAFYYIVMTLIEDVETQRNGMILLGINIGPKRRVDREVVFNVHKVRRALPLRTVGIHYCYDDLRMVPMMTLGMLAMGAASRVRFRPHYGDWKKDISYQLATFGVPAQAVPITEDGEIKTKTFRSWVKSRKIQEENQQRQRLQQQHQQQQHLNQQQPTHPSSSETKIIVLPTRSDVLFGRGKPIQDHIGNLRYHTLLEHYHNSYEEAKKFQKKQLAKQIVNTVHEYGGRFLKQDTAGAGWVEVDDPTAWDKVSHAFRTRRTTTTSTTVPSVGQSTTSIVNGGGGGTKKTSGMKSPTATDKDGSVNGKRRNVMDESPDILQSTTGIAGSLSVNDSPRQMQPSPYHHQPQRLSPNLFPQQQQQQQQQQADLQQILPLNSTSIQGSVTAATTAINAVIDGANTGTTVVNSNPVVVDSNYDFPLDMFDSDENILVNDGDGDDILNEIAHAPEIVAPMMDHSVDNNAWDQETFHPL